MVHRSLTMDDGLRHFWCIVILARK